MVQREYHEAGAVVLSLTWLASPCRALVTSALLAGSSTVPRAARQYSEVEPGESAITVASLLIVIPPGAYDGSPVSDLTVITMVQAKTLKRGTCVRTTSAAITLERTEEL